MKKLAILLLITLLTTSVLFGQTFYPDGDTFHADAVVSFDWYLDSNPVNNNFYVYDADEAQVYAVYNNPGGQNHNDGKVFAIGDYTWYAKGYDAATGTVYKTATYSFSVTEGTTPIFSPDGETFHPNQTVSFQWYVPDSATANNLFVYDSLGSNVYQTAHYPGGQNYDEGQKFANGTYSWSATYILNNDGHELEKETYSFTVEGDSNTTIITQFGITWYIKGTPDYGRFANGDFWVVGPITITQITPQSIAIDSTLYPDGPRIINGSMLNPTANDDLMQGYDSEMYAWHPDGRRLYNTAYDEAKNAARKNNTPIDSEHTLTIAANSSLVSSISLARPTRPSLKTAAVLTVLSKVPPDKSFRPAYAGKTRDVNFTVDQLDFSKLGKLAPVNPPLFEHVNRKFERVWLDHVPSWYGRYCHPTENLYDYGRGIASDMGQGAIMLNSDFTNKEKETLLIRMVQLGIDNYGILTNSKKLDEPPWTPMGGHTHGRKFPILLAGAVLGETAMIETLKNLPKDAFSEDGQYFYVAQKHIDMTHSAAWKPDARADSLRAYEEKDLGLPEWAIRNHGEKGMRLDNLEWNTPYRECCTSTSNAGFGLSVLAMNLRDEWNTHSDRTDNAFFDYMDRYMSIMADRVASGQASHALRQTDKYSERMWDAHRKSFGTIWTRDDTTDIYSNSQVSAGVQDEPDNAMAAHSFKLSQNYPNPFNPETMITYSIAADKNVNISIYNLLGQKMRTLVHENQVSGHHSVKWDGRDWAGNDVSGGVYFYRIQAGDFVRTRKMVLMR